MFKEISAQTIQMKEDEYSEFHQAYLEEALEFVDTMSSAKDSSAVEECIEEFKSYMKVRQSDYLDQYKTFEDLEFKEKEKVAMNIKVIMSVIAYDLKQALIEINSDENGKYKLSLKEDGKSLVLILDRSSMFHKDKEPLMNVRLPESLKAYTNKEITYSLFSVIFKTVLIITQNPFSS